MVELSVLGDRGIEDPLREVVSTDVPTDGDGVPSKSSDLVDDELSFPFIETTKIDRSMKPRGGRNKREERTR